MLSFFYTAVSKKVVLQTVKSLRNNVEIMVNGGFYGCSSVSAWWRETAQTRIRFFSFLVAESA